MWRLNSRAPWYRSLKCSLHLEVDIKHKAKPMPKDNHDEFSDWFFAQELVVETIELNRRKASSGKEMVNNKTILAIAAQALHPEWTARQIAEGIGCCRTNLYRYPWFTAGRKMWRSLQGGRHT